MKLADFRKKHDGQDIYIICSGKSCDYLSADFFKNKLTLGVNNVYKKFPCNYLLFKENTKLMVSYSTITSAIHLAYYMGAKNIILVGHDCCSIKNENNFEGYHDQKSLAVVWGNNIQQAKSSYKNWVSQLAQTTEAIQKILKEQYHVNLISLNPFVSLGKAATMVDK